MILLYLAAFATVPVNEYEQARKRLFEQRLKIEATATKNLKQARTAAREAVLTYLDQAAFPAWSGTHWAFYGTTTIPGQGNIACGYFVTTVLEQAGFKIQRVALAQQASAYLVTTLARDSRVDRIAPRTRAEALAHIRKRFGDGLVAIGFDYHVGLLRLDGERAEFCHASYLPPAAVTCEDPVASGAFASKLYVVADVLNDQLIDDWIAGRIVPSVLAGKPTKQ
jgi:hypothetical protein